MVFKACEIVITIRIVTLREFFNIPFVSLVQLVTGDSAKVLLGNVEDTSATVELSTTAGITTPAIYYRLMASVGPLTL
jgi:hypothetical protein